MAGFATDRTRLHLGVELGPNSLTRAHEIDNYRTHYFQGTLVAMVESPMLSANPDSLLNSSHYLLGGELTLMGGDDRNEGSRKIQLGGIAGWRQYFLSLGGWKVFVETKLKLSWADGWFNFGKGYPLEARDYFSVSGKAFLGIEIPVNREAAVSLVLLGYEYEHGFGIKQDAPDYNNNLFFWGPLTTFNFGSSVPPPVMNIPGDLISKETIRLITAALIKMRGEIEKEMKPKLRQAITDALEPQLRKDIARELEIQLRREIPHKLEPELRTQLTTRLIAEIKAALRVNISHRYPELVGQIDVDALLDYSPEPSAPIEEPSPSVEEEENYLDEEGQTKKIGKDDVPEDYNQEPCGPILFAYAKAFGELSNIVPSERAKHYEVLSKNLKEDLEKIPQVKPAGLIYFDQGSSQVGIDKSLNYSIRVLKEWVGLYKTWSQNKGLKDKLKFEVVLKGFANDFSSPRKNLELAKARTLAVKKYLVQAGLSEADFKDYVEISLSNQDSPEGDIKHEREESAAQSLQVVVIKIVPHLISKEERSTPDLLEEKP